MFQVKSKKIIKKMIQGIMKFMLNKKLIDHLYLINQEIMSFNNNKLIFIYNEGEWLYKRAE